MDASFCCKTVAEIEANFAMEWKPIYFQADWGTANLSWPVASAFPERFIPNPDDYDPKMMITI